ncbi:MAG: lysophospholipid acyltransferase family protein [Fuscovulum sp.]|nr:lysophospholipid acyltransferase family protein [Paracoccaceae bacterium]MCZ8084815.1 lysophospholipid acyltransferase family protein [Paracoccaceae bacterium]WRH62552.1 MAG: lysophospholipid acyltransferase family protein [Fuscovulum sp.]
MTETSQSEDLRSLEVSEEELARRRVERAERPYDMRRLSYAGTFKNPVKANTIRVLEWLTAKVTLLKLIRDFERTGAPVGAPFWPKAIRQMGITIQTPPEEIALIPKTGPLVVVSNHPSGLVDGMVLAELVTRVRSDFKILTRSLLTGIPEVEQFMIPVPFPHEDNARELGLQMRDETMKHLKAGGVIILFPAGKVAMSEGWWGPAVESEWNVFTHKIVKSSGATILPVYFPGQNSRAFLIANKISDTVRQGLLLYEIKRCLFKPTRPVIGAPIPAEELKKWEGNPRGFLAWLREHTLSLKK